MADRLAIDGGTPVIAVPIPSANNTKADAIAAVGAGINNYIIKPFTPDILRGKIVETLKKFHGI